LVTCLRHKILLVEDHPLVGEFLRDSLEGEGYETVGPITTEADALRIVSSCTLTAALLDFNLNSSTTLIIAEALQRQSIPFIFMSGEDLSERLPHSMQTIRQLLKPFPVHELFECIKALIPENGE
jgi:DNA-binding response OmpR family regulator